MGNLTDDMTRLCEEVGALRSARGALMRDLARGTNELAISVLAMRADFGAAHAAMAKEARENRAAFVTAMSGEVNALLADYRKVRSEKASEDRRSRASFCAGVRKYVAGMCKETADDLAGARLAWCGRGAGIPKEHPLPKGPRTVEAPAPVVEVKKAAEVPRSEGKILSTTSAKPRKAKVTPKPAKKPAKRKPAKRLKK